MFKKLKAVPDSSLTPQCCAIVDQQGWNEYYLKRRADRAEERGWSTDKCLHHSTYQINGKYYCSAHAGQELIRLMNDGQLRFVNESFEGVELDIDKAIKATFEFEKILGEFQESMKKSGASFSGK